MALSPTSSAFVNSRVPTAAKEGFTAEETKTLLGQFRGETDSSQERAKILVELTKSHPGLAAYLKRNEEGTHDELLTPAQIEGAGRAAEAELQKESPGFRLDAVTIGKRTERKLTDLQETAVKALNAPPEKKKGWW